MWVLHVSFSCVSERYKGGLGGTVGSAYEELEDTERGILVNVSDSSGAGSSAAVLNKWPLNDCCCVFTYYNVAVKKLFALYSPSYR